MSGMNKGLFYLFEERVSLRMHQTLRKELSEGRRVLYISKNSPRLLETQLEFEEGLLDARWLSPRPFADCVPPMNLEMFEDVVYEFLYENPDGIIAINGLDVMEMWNSFHPIIDMLSRLRDKINVGNNNMVMSLDPKNFYPPKLAMLESITDEIISSYA